MLAAFGQHVIKPDSPSKAHAAVTSDDGPRIVMTICGQALSVLGTQIRTRQLC